MQKLTLNNLNLKDALNKFQDVILNTPEERLEKLHYPRFKEDADCEICTSHEYLNERLKRDPLDTGWPKHARGFDINSAQTRETPSTWVYAADQLDNDVISAIGVGFSALKMYYPTNGYIGWHNNCNCPGLNLILTYSKTGNGYFEYMDPTTKEIVRMPDEAGVWTAKVGYYGDLTEPDKIFWHCAKTYEPRITVSYVIRDTNMWQDMIDDIQSVQ